MKKKALWIFWLTGLLVSVSQQGLSGAEPVTAERTVKSLSQGGAAATASGSSREPARDPFAPVIETGGAFIDKPSGKAAEGEEIVVKLEGIGIGSKEQDAFALMNKDVFYEGEEKQGIKLVRVGKQDVFILANGNPRTLSIVPEAEIMRLKQRKERKTEMEQVPVEQALI